MISLGIRGVAAFHTLSNPLPNHPQTSNFVAKASLFLLRPLILQGFLYAGSEKRLVFPSTKEIEHFYDFVAQDPSQLANKNLNLWTQEHQKLAA